MGEAEVLIFIILISAAIIAFAIVTVALVLQYRRRKINYEKEKKLAAEFHKAALLNVKMEVQEETMHRIGIEIHDSVAQKLTLASLHLQKTEYESKFSELNQTLLLSSALINESLDELRLLSRKLLNHVAEQVDIVHVLEAECERVQKLGICEVHFETDSTGIMLQSEVVHTVIRIVQELLQNSLRHSSCKNIYVRIQRNESSFILTVKDNGIGFTKSINAARPGVGLKNIRSRAELIGAELIQESTPGKGVFTKLILSEKNL